MILSWLLSTWAQLINYKKQQLIPSGILLSGSPGIGKLAFAKEYAKYLLCKNSIDDCCKVCRSCVLFQAGNHPDYFLIQPEEKSQQIKIEQIRNLINHLGQTSVLGGFQIAIIALAEEMNRASCNALLKTLEEPRGNVTILLVSQQPSAIPATVISRCQHIALLAPNVKEASQWLKGKIGTEERVTTYLAMADNLPMKALACASSEDCQVRDNLLQHLLQVCQDQLDPIQAAASCLTLPVEKLHFLLTITLDMVRIKLLSKMAYGEQSMVVVSDFLNNRDKLATLTELSHQVSLEDLFRFLDNVLEAIRLLMSRNNVNLQLLMEKIFINWRYNNEVS